MAEYIDKSEVLELKRDYGEGQYSMMLIDPALVKKLPTTDVVEREKVKQARESVQKYINACDETSVAGINMKSGLAFALEILDELIESCEWIEKKLEIESEDEG